MSLNSLAGLGWSLGVDILIVTLLAFGLYYRRNRKLDLAGSFIAVNIGVFALVSLLAGMPSAAMGLGFGLFGILSIVRLRSAAIRHDEVGYYLVALVLGLVNGMAPNMPLAAILLDVGLLAVMFFVDHPHWRKGTQCSSVMLDRVIIDQEELVDELAVRLDSEIRRCETEAVNYVQDTTLVTVWHRKNAAVPAKRPRAARAGRRDVRAGRQSAVAATPDPAAPAAAGGTGPHVEPVPAGRREPASVMEAGR
ncbi:DUF4956 domain-containing protein [Spelaeicoccus albus]|uniref:DUF4956 domain-containing protein n=1 Tax=Spelaeicoccus albus TaxID=1280376 RepID=A0A7Z0D4I9_9MICO|nr:DUF4956 domain-containing protein [Spelaeicoccus albus]NYI68671.1 hypothetical protein [Spelaeicoccus albus]